MLLIVSCEAPGFLVPSCCSWFVALWSGTWSTTTPTLSWTSTTWTTGPRGPGVLVSRCSCFVMWCRVRVAQFSRAVRSKKCLSTLFGIIFFLFSVPGIRTGVPPLFGFVLGFFHEPFMSLLLHGIPAPNYCRVFSVNTIVRKLVADLVSNSTMTAGLADYFLGTEIKFMKMFTVFCLLAISLGVIWAAPFFFLHSFFYFLDFFQDPVVFYIFWQCPNPKQLSTGPGNWDQFFFRLGGGTVLWSVRTTNPDWILHPLFKRRIAGLIRVSDVSISRLS